MMRKLADPRLKNKTQSLYGWSKELGHDERTVEKNLEQAMDPGVLRAYGGEPRAKVVKVPICTFHYKVDPPEDLEPLDPTERRVARANCEDIAMEQPTVWDMLEAVERCWSAYGPPGTSNGGPQATEPSRSDASPTFDWSLLLSVIPGMIALGVGVVAAFLTPQPQPARPSPSTSPPAASFDLFDFTTWLNSPSPSPTNPPATWDSSDPVKLVNDILWRPT